MSSPEWMGVRPGRCDGCGELLGADPHYITEPPDGIHLRCKDWASTPWPFEKLERTLAARRIALRTATTAVVELGAYIRRSRASWPDRMIVEVVRARVAALPALLERAGARRAVVEERDPRH